MSVPEIICSSCHSRTPHAPRCGSCGQEPILNGRYRLLDVKGSGSFGTTYRAERVDDGQVVAVKEIVVRRVESLKVLELFEREAKVLEQLDHGSTVAGTFGYMAPEQFQGRALSQTDVYGVGATAVALLSGQDPQRLMKDDRTLGLEPLNLSEPFQRVLAGMLTNSPETRFGPVEALTAIRSVLSGNVALVPIEQTNQMMLGDRPRQVPVVVRHAIEERKQISTMLGFTLLSIPLLMLGMLAAFSFLGMPMSWHLYAAFGFFGGVFGLIGVGVPIYARSKAKMDTELWEMGLPIKVRLDKVDRSRTGQGRPMTSVYYSYDWNGKTYQGYWHAAGKCGWKVNQQVDAFMSEESPSKSTLIPPSDLENDY